jgi:hypothetical protein
MFDSSSCTGGSITVSIAPSRTSCAAPCFVFFDATGTTGLATVGTTANDFVAANFDWDFNDPTSIHKGSIGFIQAHVFDNPGTYHVLARVHDAAGNAGSTTTTVTVSAMSGTVYYVASSGNDSNGGTSTTTPFLTVAHALSVGSGTNKTILFRNGDTFALGASDTTIAVTGPWRMGGYSDPGAPSVVAPVLNSTDVGAFASVFVLTGTDLRFTDLKITGNVLTSGGNLFADQAKGNLIERVESNVTGSTGVNMFAVDGTTSQAGMFDCNFHDFGGYGVFAGAGSNDLAVVGNNIANFTGMDHGIRVQGGSVSFGSIATSTNTVLDGNTITPITTFDAIAVRGDNRYTVVVNNVATNSINATPQNASAGGSDEHVQHVLIEGNYVTQTNPFRIVANHVIVRNNLAIGTDVAFEVENNACSSFCLAANWVDQIIVYNNTAYSATTPGYSTDFILHQRTTGNVTFQDNIFQTGSTNTASSMLFTDAAGTETFDHNLIYDPSVSVSTPNTGTGGVNNSNPLFTTPGSDFHLQSGSPAKDSGSNTHVYESLGLAPGRPQNSAWDMGAYERKNP